MWKRLRAWWRVPATRRRGVAGMMCATAAAVALAASGWGWLDRPENALQSALLRGGRMAPADPRLVFLAIDQESKSLSPLDLQTLFSGVKAGTPEHAVLTLMAEEFPWSRAVHAAVIDRLIGAGATVVGMDLLFTTPRRGDAELRAAMERHPGRVVLASNFVQVALGQGEAWTLDQPMPEVMPRGAEGEMAATVAGFVNFFADRDGWVRRAHYQTSERERNGLLPLPGEPPLRSFAARLAAALGEEARVPADTAPRRLRFAGPPTEGFPPRSLFEIFVPEYWRNNFQAGEFFRGKAVVVGAFGDWQNDMVLTPFADQMPGAELHLNALNAVLQGAFLREAPGWWTPLSVLAMAAGAMLTRAARPALRLLPLALGAGLLLVGTWAAHEWADLALPVVPALGTLLLGGAAGLGFDFAVERTERARLRRTLESYVSRNVVRQILDDPADYSASLGGVRKEVTVLFSDVRDFTEMTEDADPHELVRHLNEYFQEMVGCVFRNHGSLDKFIGDAVMAVWGNTSASRGLQRDASDAVRCALEMRAALTRLNVRWKAEGRRELRIGIGLNHGDAIVGNLGSAEKMEFTAIGDAVNVASRMEGLTKNYGVDLLIGESVADLVHEEFLLQPADCVRVKGKKKPVEIYAVLGESSAELREMELRDGLQAYLDGLDDYRNGRHDEALASFAEATELRPADPLTARYRALLERAQSGDSSASWSGATVMTDK